MRFAAVLGGMVWGVMLCLIVPASAWALDPATTGVVVMHGKWGNPGQMSVVADPLRDAGFLVELPTMPWAGNRLFDVSYDAAMGEITQAAEKLRAKGAQRIVVLGQSLGGNAVLAYAARTPDLAVLVAFAPAHFPDGSFIRDKAVEGVARAKAMVAAGQGAEKAGFTSFNDGDRTKSVQVGAADYLSYYSPDGPASMSLFAARLPNRPTLIVTGSRDATAKVFERLVKPLIPASVPVEYREINGGHMDVPAAAAALTVEWLKALELRP